jgi:hypothetical protein
MPVDIEPLIFAVQQLDVKDGRVQTLSFLEICLLYPLLLRPLNSVPIGGVGSTLSGAAKKCQKYVEANGPGTSVYGLIKNEIHGGTAKDKKSFCKNFGVVLRRMAFINEFALNTAIAMKDEKLSVCCRTAYDDKIAKSASALGKPAVGVAFATMWSREKYIKAIGGPDALQQIGAMARNLSPHIKGLESFYVENKLPY